MVLVDDNDCNGDSGEACDGHNGCDDVSDVVEGLFLTARGGGRKEHVEKTRGVEAGFGRCGGTLVALVDNVGCKCERSVLHEHGAVRIELDDGSVREFGRVDSLNLTFNAEAVGDVEVRTRAHGDRVVVGDVEGANDGNGGAWSDNE